MTFSKPAWQRIVPYGLTPAEFTSRGVPNVSAVASSTDPGVWIATTKAAAAPTSAS